MKDIQAYSDEDIMDEFYGRSLDRFNGEYELDYKDKEMLDAIVERFLIANWAEREEMYKQII